MSEYRRDVSDIPSSNKGSQRQIWQSELSVPFGEAQRGKRREGEGDGTNGTHHITSKFGLSCRQRLLQILADVDVQDRTMRVSQGRSRLRVMPVNGAVCQPRAPDSRGRDAEQEGHGGKGEGEAQAVEGENEGGTAGGKHGATVTGESGAGERRGRVGREHGDIDATRGGRGDDGRRARL